jgi:hypothetical protein
MLNKNLIISFYLVEDDNEVQPAPVDQEDKLADGVFKGLDSLTSLKINEFNNFIHIERESFRFLPNLESLSMNNNSLSSVESHTFASFKKIRELDLNVNKLKKFPSIENLLSLDTLRLYQNKITRIIEPGKTRQVNTKLRVLELSNNELTDVGSGALSGFSNLKELELQNNSISSWSSESLNGLTKIDFIKLGSNPFERICAGLFANMSRLRYIELRNMEKLKVIDQQAFGDAKTRNRKIKVDIDANADYPIAELLKPLAAKGLITINAY